MNDPILFWNAVALEVHRRDFTFNGAGDSFSAGDFIPEQPGPTRVSRSFAMVHIAMHQAYAKANPGAGLPPYAPIAPLPTAPALTPSLAPTPATITAQTVLLAAGAVAGAAITVLKSQWPKQAGYIDQQLPQSPWPLSDTDFINGLDYGHTVGLAMINIREAKGVDGLFQDGSQAPDDKNYSAVTWHHRPDPFNPAQMRLGTKWGSVTPFSIPRPVNLATYIAPYPDPVAHGSRYDAAVDDVNKLGKNAGSTRSHNETVAGIYWGYDGPRGLGVPPRLYNQMVRAFVEEHGASNTVAENASLFTSINVGMADAAIVAWSAKYHFDLWRPVVGIREHDTGFGLGHGDRSNLMPISAHCDPTWPPLGRPGTNNYGDMTKTPDFPAYPSGHATFGAVTFRLTARFFAKKLNITTKKAMNELEFSFVSDEFNGVNQDPNGSVRPYHNRRFSLREAIIENALSRVYLGVHWRFDGLGAVAPKDLEGDIPKDPAFNVKLAPAIEKKLGGVPIGLEIASQVFNKF